MQVRIRETGKVMYEDEFRKLNPNTSFPQIISEAALNDFGADVVLEGPQATITPPYQYSQAAGVEQINGQWYTKYIAGPVFTNGETTAAEQEVAYKTSKDAEQAESVRTSRNNLLKDSDWTQITDATADKTAWATYRQALRDVTAQAGFPQTITWPDAP
jgi:hypothetical protein